MKTNEVLIIGAIGIGAFLLAKKNDTTQGKSPDGSVQITIYDKDGKVVPAHSPVTLKPGQSYFPAFTVKNTSTQDGQPVAATLHLVWQALLNGQYIIQPHEEDVTFAAGQPLRFDESNRNLSFTVPADLQNGATGIVLIEVKQPNETFLKNASQELTVKQSAIVYGADVTFL